MEALTAGTSAHYPPEADGYPLVIIVMEVRDGIRARRPFYTNLPESTPEAILNGFLELIGQAEAQGYTGKLNLDDVAILLGIPPRGRRH